MSICLFDLCKKGVCVWVYGTGRVNKNARTLMRLMMLAWSFGQNNLGPE